MIHKISEDEFKSFRQNWKQSLWFLSDWNANCNEIEMGYSDIRLIGFVLEYCNAAEWIFIRTDWRFSWVLPTSVKSTWIYLIYTIQQANRQVLVICVKLILHKCYSFYIWTLAIKRFLFILFLNHLENVTKYIFAKLDQKHLKYKWNELPVY